MSFITQQVVKESPINLRDFLKIKKDHNVKGIALFLMTYINLYKYSKNDKIYNSINNLEKILDSYAIYDDQSLSWGHNFKWITSDNLVKSNQANITNTYFSSLAYFGLSIFDDDSKVVISKINNFISEKLYIQIESIDKLAYSYFTFPQKNIVNNVQGMIGSFYLNYSKLFVDNDYYDKAKKIFNYLKSQMNSNDTWNYHNGKGYNKIDSYHSAYILDSFWELYQFSKSEEDLDFYLRCLKSYEDKFWGPNGEPYWSVKYRYPYDIHSAANGIISFAKASVIDKKYLDKSKLILNWTIKNMYREKEQDFIYRIFGPLKYNYSFIRWGNAWMCYAIAEYLKFQQFNINENLL